MISLISIALILGLSSSLHCVGMCGPIAMILPIQQAPPAEKLFKTVVYHLGRILVYALLGAIFGMMGKTFQLMGLLQAISIVFGALIIAGVIFPRIFARFHFFNRIHMKLNGFVHGTFGKLIKRKSTLSLFMLGMINGLLPCGAVYFALLGSLVYGGLFEGALFMAIFGLGTLPAMATITYFASSISISLREKFRKASPVILILFGGLFIVRGMNLNIPLISPKVEITETGETEVSCCSKKGTDECVSKKRVKAKER
jgi:sulfite exporter TauE/SafE